MKSMGGDMGSLGGWQAMKSYRRDSKVTQRQLPKGLLMRILRFGAHYRRTLITYLVLIVVSAILSTVSPLIFRAIIDDGIVRHNVGLIVWLALLAAGVALVSAGLMLWQRYISARVGEGLIYDMRTKIFDHFQSMPLAFFSRTQSGALISRINSDVLNAQSAFTDTTSSIVSNLITVVITLGVMFFLSWQITLAALILLPLFIIPARWVGRKIEGITRESYNLNAEMTNTMTERFNVSGALLVKLFGDPNRESGTFSGRAGRVRDIGVTQAMYTRIFMVALLTTASLATALAYGWGGVEAVHGVYQVGTVVAITLYLTRLYAPLTALSNVQVDVMTTLVSFDRVFEVLDLKPTIVEAPDAVSIPRGPATVEFAHVTFRYPTAREVSLASLENVENLERGASPEILHDVSFVIRPGTMVALVGPSGAGKTTLSHLVPRLYDPETGTVSINGVDLRTATQASVRATVGVVTQEAHLFHDTLRANLLYAKPDATDDEIHAALEAAQIAHILATLPDGLDTVVGDRGYRLSGGEKQRVAIARLLLKSPDVVVLDEATAHLDSESEAAIQVALAHALSDRTSLVIAHRLSTIREADEILVLDAGRIVAHGTHHELLAAGGLYADLYHTQFADQELTLSES
ncbi:MAG: ABC transporter ATP-binding protein/permease [Ferrimicrobium sp.]|jgi:ATP-binding cassette subfamily B protein|nr:ABC transporter ATP-binding protein/permease [Ferrimicrobium sp.]